VTGLPGQGGDGQSAGGGKGAVRRGEGHDERRWPGEEGRGRAGDRREVGEMDTWTKADPEESCSMAFVASAVACAAGSEGASAQSVSGQARHAQADADAAVTGVFVYLCVLASLCMYIDVICRYTDGYSNR